MSVCVRPDPYICVSDTAHLGYPPRAAVGMPKRRLGTQTQIEPPITTLDAGRHSQSVSQSVSQ